MFQLDEAISHRTKAELYDELATQLLGLLEGERDTIANAAHAAAVRFHMLPDLNWAVFYLMRDG